MLYRAERREWERLDRSSSDAPQNLYELTSLAYDSRRDQLILHGGGPRRDELWTFDMRSHAWRNMQPTSSGARRRVRVKRYTFPSETYL